MENNKNSGTKKWTQYSRLHKPSMNRTDQDQRDNLMSYLSEIMILLRAHTGHDFTSYKKTTVHRRIERRMDINQIYNPSAYVRLLQESPKEHNGENFYQHPKRRAIRDRTVRNSSSVGGCQGRDADISRRI